MSSDETVKAVLIGGRGYSRSADGTLVPIEERSDWRRFDALTDKEIEAAVTSDPDAVPMTDDEWARAEIPARATKVSVGIRLDAEVLDWFKAQGSGYQTRINAVLKRYVAAQRKAG